MRLLSWNLAGRKKHLVEQANVSVKSWFYPGRGASTGYHFDHVFASTRLNLRLPGCPANKLPGAGVFPRFSPSLQLTAADSPHPSRWELLTWFCPDGSRPPLTHHGEFTRWQKTEMGVRLQTVARGQEFILDCDEYPEALEWFKGLLEGS